MEVKTIRKVIDSNKFYIVSPNPIDNKDDALLIGKADVDSLENGVFIKISNGDSCWNSFYLSSEDCKELVKFLNVNGD